MLKYGKTVQSAISAVSYLAECYDGGESLVSSLEIAEVRQLSKPLVAKLLTTLSQAGFVKGSTGPRGGYTLAQPPEEITLLDVVSQFERIDNQVLCPFGPNWCGIGDPCPLHDALVQFDTQMTDYLRGTHFGVFQKQHHETKNKREIPAS